jgi:tetratricopeptide (TPR) repeat protein
LFWIAYNRVYNPGALFLNAEIEYLYTLRAIINLELDDYQSAETDLKVALHQNPNYALAYLIRGYVEGLRGREAQARRSFDLFVDVQGGNETALALYCRSGMPFHGVLIPILVASLQRYDANMIPLQHEGLDQTSSAQRRLFPRDHASLSDYEISPAQKRSGYSRFHTGEIALLNGMGLGYFMTAFLVARSKRTYSKRQKGEIGWTDVRPYEVRWSGDMANHLSWTAGLVLIASASFRIQVSGLAFGLSLVGLVVQIGRLCYWQARLAALEQGLTVGSG